MLTLKHWPEYKQLMRLDRPIGIYLLLWPTLWGLWFAAEGRPDWWTLFVFIAGVVLMRSAGCVINDYADREFDPQVARTKTRPLAAGKVDETEALALFCVLSIIAFLLVLTLNKLTILLSFVAVLLVASYPFHKRFTHMPQAHLGMAFGWAIPMAFAAVQNQIPPLAWLLWFTVVVWAIAYDTLYAMVDREDDLAIGVKSSAILFGQYDSFIVGCLQILMLLLLALAGALAELNLWYLLGLLAAAGLFAWQQWLLRHREPAAGFAAFLNNHWVGLVVFIGLFLAYC